MSVKEESELSTIKKACQVTVDVFSKYLKEQIMDIIDGDKKVGEANHHKKISFCIHKQNWLYNRIAKYRLYVYNLKARNLCGQSDYKIQAGLYTRFFALYSVHLNTTFSPLWL